jgi:hypothetical protein
MRGLPLALAIAAVLWALLFAAYIAIPPMVAPGIAALFGGSPQ